MEQNTSLSLDDHFASFREQEVASGRYRPHSEVIRAGLRLLEDQTTQRVALRSALATGERSGEAELLDVDVFVAGKKA